MFVWSVRKRELERKRELGQCAKKETLVMIEDTHWAISCHIFL